MECQYCSSTCKKDGTQKNGVQKYRCKSCKKYQQKHYQYQAKVLLKKKMITKLIVNNCGFRGIARVLNMSVNTIRTTILQSSKFLKEPSLPVNGIYEIDEMSVYKNKVWAVYGMERSTGKVIGISIGSRSKNTIRKTINRILMTSPKRIYTDGLSVYKSIIPNFLHKVPSHLLWKIERTHLTVRNRIKMLNEKTLGFVRKPETLMACLKLLFWHK